MFSKLLLLCFMALFSLVGCKASEPSNADIQKQLLAQLSPCPEITIQNFQKINGYPQQDGSYVEQVQYDLVFTPSHVMLNYVSDWNAQLAMFKSSVAADGTKATAILAVAKTMYDKCEADENASSIESDCGGMRANFIRNPDNNPVFQRIEAVNQQANIVLNKDLNAVQSEMNNDCPVVVIGGVLGLFGGSKTNIEAYGKTYTLAEQGTAHFVQSDNGWVMQN